MLNSLEVESLLFAEGFKIAEERTHAIAYSHPLLGGRLLYLKDGRAHRSEMRRAVGTQPLVVHPDTQSLPGFESTRVASLEPNRFYKNGNMSSFPRLNGASAYGIAVDIPDMEALAELLQLVGLVMRHAPSCEEDIAAASDLPLEETERKAVIAARRGQGVFRANLDSRWGGCAATGCTIRALLRASHIKPWRQSNNAERLDEHNGLLLAAHLDAAFDQGLISFAEDGCILINTSRLPPVDADRVGIHSGLRILGLQPGHYPYLAQHRRLHGFE